MDNLTGVCACGCGTPVAKKWARGHSARGEGGYQAAAGGMPPPDDPWWELDGGGPHDAGILEPDEVAPSPPPADLPGGGEGSGPVYEPGPVTPDPPPLHGDKGWKRSGPKSAPKKPTRITAAVRGDIDAKISFALEIPGRIWQARDPVCGTVFVEQRPEISGALTEIVCQSPDLVAWFAGGGGQFMLALNLMATLWPVVTVVMAHHVYHTVELGPPEPAADQPYRQYAA